MRTARTVAEARTAPVALLSRTRLPRHSGCSGVPQRRAQREVQSSACRGPRRCNRSCQSPLPACALFPRPPLPCPTRMSAAPAAAPSAESAAAAAVPASAAAAGAASPTDGQLSFWQSSFDAHSQSLLQCMLLHTDESEASEMNSGECAEILSVCAFRRPWVVNEWAAGMGRLTPLLASLVGFVYASDFVEAFCEQNREQCRKAGAKNVQVRDIAHSVAPRPSLARRSIGRARCSFAPRSDPPVALTSSPRRWTASTPQPTPPLSAVPCPTLWTPSISSS